MLALCIMKQALMRCIFSGIPRLPSSRPSSNADSYSWKHHTDHLSTVAFLLRSPVRLTAAGRQLLQLPARLRGVLQGPGQHTVSVTHSRAGMDTLDRVMEEGFSIPRTPRGSSLLRACSGLLSSGSKDVMYDEESVLQFFCMANAALRAKTEANAVRAGVVRMAEPDIACRRAGPRERARRPGRRRRCSRRRRRRGPSWRRSAPSS